MDCDAATVGGQTPIGEARGLGQVALSAITDGHPLVPAKSAPGRGHLEIVHVEVGNRPRSG